MICASLHGKENQMIMPTNLTSKNYILLPVVLNTLWLRCKINTACIRTVKKYNNFREIRTAFCTQINSPQPEQPCSLSMYIRTHQILQDGTLYRNTQNRSCINIHENVCKKTKDAWTDKEWKHINQKLLYLRTNNCKFRF